MPEPQLNGAYYGPSIPTSSRKAYHRPGRGSSSCNPFSCCCECLCGCIFNCIFQIIFTLLIILGIVILALWLVFRPNKLKFDATDASLTQFELSTTNNNTLSYDLALNITVRNPNKRLSIYYDSIQAYAFYQDQRFASTELDAFHQGHKNTSFLHPVFNSQNFVSLGSNGISNYNQDKGSGMYNIKLKLNIRMRLKFWWFKSPKIKPTIDCDLKIPLTTNGQASGTFESTRCGLDW